MADKPLCDLCGKPHPTWNYPADDFLVVMHGVVISRSVSYWAACDGCHRILEAGDTEALAIRCLDQYLGEHTEDSMDLDSILAIVHEVHAQFYAHRTGPPKLLEVTYAGS